MYKVGQKLRHFVLWLVPLEVSIDSIGTKFGTNQRYFILSITSYSLLETTFKNKVAPSIES